MSQNDNSDELTLPKGIGPGDTTLRIDPKYTPNRYSDLPDESSWTNEYVYDNYAGTYVERRRLCKGSGPHYFVNVGFHFDNIVCKNCGKKEESDDIKA